MLNFMFDNRSYFIAYYSQFNISQALTAASFNDVIFPMLIYLWLLIDTVYFSFGYCFEADFMKNRVRSVEPTLLGWVVALVCYPPFNQFFSDYAVWYADVMARYSTESLTFTIKALVLVMFSIYLLATLALGAKCSNLTNRGIVSGGPYSYIRHPAYVSKNIAWWLTLIPIMSAPIFVNMLVWSFIYYLRAMTEEMHLIKDPEYQQYCHKVKYRFIPYVW
jgi:protein-S-isoprenylcysteine O-methyltransferase Ste14